MAKPPTRAVTQNVTNTLTLAGSVPEPRGLLASWGAAPPEPQECYSFFQTAFAPTFAFMERTNSIRFTCANIHEFELDRKQLAKYYGIAVNAMARYCHWNSASDDGSLSPGDALLAAYKKLRSYCLRNPAKGAALNLEPYFTTVVTHAVIDHCRARRSQTQVEAKTDVTRVRIGIEPEDDSEWVKRTDRNRINDCIVAKIKTHAQTWAYRLMKEDRDNSDIARSLGEPEANVRRWRKQFGEHYRACVQEVDPAMSLEVDPVHLCVEASISGRMPWKVYRSWRKGDTMRSIAINSGMTEAEVSGWIERFQRRLEQCRIDLNNPSYDND